MFLLRITYQQHAVRVYGQTLCDKSTWQTETEVMDQVYYLT